MLSSAKLFISSRYEIFLTESDGEAAIKDLQSTFNIEIKVSQNELSIRQLPGCVIDPSTVEIILSDNFKKFEDNITIRKAVLNESSSHVCHMALPLVYSSLAAYYENDILSSSKCDGIVNDYVDGRLAIFGSEESVKAAINVFKRFLFDHFGPLPIQFPEVVPTAKTNAMPHNISLAKIRSSFWRRFFL